MPILLTPFQLDALSGGSTSFQASCGVTGCESRPSNGFRPRRVLADAAPAQERKVVLCCSGALSRFPLSRESSAGLMHIGLLNSSQPP